MNRSLKNSRRAIGLQIVAFSIAVATGSSIAQAAGPAWDSLVPFKKIDADPAQMYPVAQNNGPWMIMAMTFRGEKASEQARLLVYEFRSRYKLPAYSYEKTFDFSKPVQGRGVDAHGRPNVGHYQSSLVKEVAVMVGDYDTVDDANAQKTLARIKTLEPECLKHETAKNAQSSDAFRQIQKTLTASQDKSKKGPMIHAMIATNPLLPREYFAAKGVDKLVLDMNKGVEHSLLDCKGKYSVRVATFNGSVLIDQRKIREVEKGKQLESKLAEAAEKAHKLTEALRKKGWEAYEFHDRETSMVCIGHFDAVGMPRQDGKIEIDPDIHKIMNTFGADKSGLSTGQALKPKHEAGIALDIQPIPVEVPKRSISADYQRSMRQERL